jgi:hypothetical protein
MDESRVPSDVCCADAAGDAGLAGEDAKDLRETLLW